jgi:large subunit ribosomal protein L9
LKGQGVEVEKSMVRMPSGPLKQVGEHPVSIVLHTDVTAHINVNVVGETVGA